MLIYLMQAMLYRQQRRVLISCGTAHTLMLEMPKYQALKPELSAQTDTFIHLVLACQAQGTNTANTVTLLMCELMILTDIIPEMLSRTVTVST